ncbi:MAG: SUMF1/EgtB/PvdO family nonheme iron enzyme [bacterium]|nr:SUMF1/EgtB/PvdO family nonheme iron enzyme [Candidatus Limimorpha caballi]
MKKNIMLIVFALLLLGGCKKDEEVYVSRVQTETPDVTPSTNRATISGTYRYASRLKSVVIAYGKDASLSSPQKVTAELGYGFSYSVTINDLEPSTKYYYYCIFDTGYGATESEQWSFTTNSVVTDADGNMVATVNDVTFKMIKVEGGTFTMGGTSEQGDDAESDEKPTHSVTLSDYYIGKFEVTQELWKAVMGSNPSHFKGNNLPVEEVSWDDCQTFIRKLNTLTGKNFRLPTEAEWEYAARGGNKSRGYKYSGSNSIGDVAWYKDNSWSETHAVGTKSPNELGIYDMSGNVYEWCQDWYGSYGSGSQTNPQGPSFGSDRVRRGGGWRYNAQYCRVSNRHNYAPDSRYNYLGFRLVVSQ